MSRPRSLSLAAYRALSWGTAPRSGQKAPERPKGEVLWVHVATRDRLAPIEDFFRRLLPHRPGLSLVMTIPRDQEPKDWGKSGYARVLLPDESPRAARDFLDHWRPDAGLWVGGGLEPIILLEAAERYLPLTLIEAEPDVNIPLGRRWLPDIARHTLDCFRSIYAASEVRAREIRRQGLAYAKVGVAAPLQVSPNPPPWPEDELTEINAALTGRPLWLAAWVQDTEFISVLSAHRQALRLLPRLALILHAADAAETGPLRKRLEAADLRCADWDGGDAIEDSTQVILVSHAEDLGLWYRVSPVTFMGSSLQSGQTGRYPLIATALGSAIIHGPHVRQYGAIYAQLNQAFAARQIRSASDLGGCVVDLLAPDQAANMALAGWTVVTDGAKVTDDLIDRVQDDLDSNGADHAGT